MKIHLLEKHIINQIAAGEVLERPASALKEMMENALDAGAHNIDVSIVEGGKALIRVQDDGCGMGRDDLSLAITRHATSKVQDLFAIETFGFRGEALAAISSVSRCTITSIESPSAEDASRDAGTEVERRGWYILAEGGNVCESGPTNHRKGTIVEVKDLFYATPARLKFLKTNATETEQCISVFDRMALAFPEVSFSLQVDGKLRKKYAAESLIQRTSGIYGAQFIDNAIALDHTHEAFHVSGFISVTTYNKSVSQYIDVFINNRYVKDKFLLGVIRAAYNDFLPHGRYPQVVLFISMPYNCVDVNAHPAKTEVRFKDTQQVRNALFSAIKSALKENELRSIDINVSTLQKMHTEPAVCAGTGGRAYSYVTPATATTATSAISTASYASNHALNLKAYARDRNIFSKSHAEMRNEHSRYLQTIQNMQQSETLAAPYKSIPAEQEDITSYKPNATHEISSLSNLQATFQNESENTGSDLGSIVQALGQSLGQLARKYIIAISGDDLVIVDQHAACERMRLEQLRTQKIWHKQTLLFPTFVQLSEDRVEHIFQHYDTLSTFGFDLQKSAKDSVMVIALPEIIADEDPELIISDLADELSDESDPISLHERIKAVMAKQSCYGSIRAGKELSTEEMDSILRQMEVASNIAQCTHGRPSFLRIPAHKLDKLFERV